MNNEQLITIIKFAIQFGIDAAISIAKMFKTGATIDDAIAALEMAKSKTAQNYLDEAKANLPPSPPSV